MSPRLAFMLEIIQKLGEFQHKHFRTEIEFETKSGEMDLVSFVDRECEKMFQEAVNKEFPGDAIAGEESYNPETDYQKYDKLWIIDPLDGTLMFKRGIPVYGCMIAYVENHSVHYSAIYLPELQELYHANENGAYRNDKPIRVSDTKNIGSAIIHTSTNMLKRALNSDVKFCEFLNTIGKHIDTYSCALSLPLCASGGTDGDIFFPKTGRYWDTVPGGFLIQQAGGKVTNFGSDSWDIFNPNVIFSNGYIHAEFQKLLEL